jgi:hypothetical protein
MKSNKPIQQIQNLYEKHLEDMVHRHSKVFQVRFDLHYPSDGSVEHDPKQIRDFNEYMKRDLERNYPLPKDGQRRSSGKDGEETHKVDPRIISVREQHEESPHVHYHCLCLVNGKA